MIPELDLGGVLPALILCVAGLVVMLLGLFIRKGVLAFSAIVSLVSVIVALAANNPLRGMHRQAFAGLINVDPYSWFCNVLLLVAAGVTGTDLGAVFE